MFRQYLRWDGIYIINNISINDKTRFKVVCWGTDEGEIVIISVQNTIIYLQLVNKPEKKGKITKRLRKKMKDNRMTEGTM